MDQNILVSQGQTLLGLMTRSGPEVVGAIWVNNPEIDSWKLWLVPKTRNADKLEFYRKLGSVFTKNRNELTGLDISDTEMMDREDSVIKAMGRMFRVAGPSSVFISGNSFNGYFVPNGIILELEL